MSSHFWRTLKAFVRCLEEERVVRMALEIIGKMLLDKGVELLNEQIAENGELQFGQAKEALVKFVEESDVRQRYGLVKSYCQSIEDLYDKLKREDWYVFMAGDGTYMRGTSAHKNWRLLSGRYLFNQDWYYQLYDGHPEGKMFLRVHLHILLDSVGLTDLQNREDDIEKNWGQLLSVNRDYQYGKIWNAYFAFGPPEESQFFSHAGTLYSARYYKYLDTVFNMYKQVVGLLYNQGRIANPILDYTDDYYVITIFAGGMGGQNIS